jgi:hypothetical protein
VSSRPHYSAPFDSLFEGPAPGCEERLFVRRTGTGLRGKLGVSLLLLMVCSKDRHWVARTAWMSIDLVRSCRAGHTTLPLLILCSKDLHRVARSDCLFEGPAPGCEEGLQLD